MNICNGSAMANGCLPSQSRLMKQLDQINEHAAQLCKAAFGDSASEAMRANFGNDHQRVNEQLPQGYAEKLVSVQRDQLLQKMLAEKEAYFRKYGAPYEPLDPAGSLYEATIMGHPVKLVNPVTGRVSSAAPEVQEQTPRMADLHQGERRSQLTQAEADHYQYTARKGETLQVWRERMSAKLREELLKEPAKCNGGYEALNLGFLVDNGDRTRNSDHPGILKEQTRREQEVAMQPVPECIPRHRTHAGLTTLADQTRVGGARWGVEP